MGEQRAGRQTLQMRECQEVSELNLWAKAHQDETAGKKYSIRSNDLGGHLELKEGNSDNLIGPSEKKVQKLLENYGEKLGIHYVSR